MLMTADRIGAADAPRLGLAQRIVPPSALMNEVMRITEMIPRNSQVTVQASKQVAYFWRTWLSASRWTATGRCRSD
jgi:enoyl-CoA hydratase/carnithine racemase